MRWRSGTRRDRWAPTKMELDGKSYGDSWEYLRTGIVMGFQLRVIAGGF